MLPAVPVLVNDTYATFALIDSCSTQTFCSEALASKLNLSGEKTTINVGTLDKESSPKRSECVKLKICALDGSYNLSVASAYITSYIPAPKIPSINYLSQKHLGHINSLPSDYVVDILFGQDCPDVVKVLETKDGGPGKPYASRSALGWSVRGPIPRNMICHSVTLDQAVEKMWSLDNELSDERLHSYDDRMVGTKLLQWNMVIM